MASIDPSAFHPINVIDTCSVWNVLSSLLLYSASREAGCDFCITEFVRYECLDKKRRTPTPAQNELAGRLRRERAKGVFAAHACSLDDLQDLKILESRMRLGKGELSSIAFAKRIGQAVLTDDRKAKRLSEESGTRFTQTTPHLLSWLVFTGRLGDAGVATVVADNRSMGLPLSPHFLNAHRMALECRLNAGPPRA